MSNNNVGLNGMILYSEIYYENSLMYYRDVEFQQRVGPIMAGTRFRMVIFNSDNLTIVAYNEDGSKANEIELVPDVPDDSDGESLGSRDSGSTAHSKSDDGDSIVVSDHDSDWSVLSSSSSAKSTDDESSEDEIISTRRLKRKHFDD
jgi:hypothetical protein